MSVIIDNITYNIEDENLMDIEYYEILTMDEMIKDNPTFIAFSRDEIINELYDFFKMSNKAEHIADLFFKINVTNLVNYVFVANATKIAANATKFVANATKKDYDCDTDVPTDFVNQVLKLNKLPYNISQTEKQKYFFALTYDTDNKPTVKLNKPATKTTVEIPGNSGVNPDRETDRETYRVYYPILTQDDTNIPILAVYYKKPPVSLDDPLSQKIIAHLEKTDLLNYLEAEGFSEIDKLLKVAKPKMETIIKYLKPEEDDYYLDHNNLNGFLQRFDTSFDDISVKDFDILSQHLKELTKDIEPHKITYKKYKLKPSTVSNDKILFFNKINNTATKLPQLLKSLDITDKMREDYDMLITTLQEEKMNINTPPLLYNNINDIIKAIINNDVSLEDLIQNLEANRNVLIIDHSIKTLKGIQLGASDLENIVQTLDHLTNSFRRILFAVANGYKDIFDYRFIDFYHDVKEIKQANDYSDYEGIPDIYKNIPNFEGQILDDIGVAEDDDAPTQPVVNAQQQQKMDLEKYWLSIKYKNASGFTDMLKIVLPIISNTESSAKLMLNYERLCDELYKQFSTIPTKFDLMQGIFNNAGIKLTDEFITNITKINTAVALNVNMLRALQISDELIKYVYQCNTEYIDIITDMLQQSIAWWSLQIVDDIVHNVLIYDENHFLVTYVDKWSLDGSPLKDSRQGVLPYLSAILEDVLRDSEGVGITMAEGVLLKNASKIIESKYKDMLEEMRAKGISNHKKRNNKGKDTYEQLLDTIKNRDGNKLLNDYVNALIYMPSYKYKQLHKFLLGCCLQQIGKSFTPDADIVANGRKDLQSAKKKYAKLRFTQNKRYKTFMLPLDEAAEEAETTADEDTFIKPDAIDQMPDISANNIDKWLKAMIDVSNLLPNDKITLFMKSTKEATALCKNYIAAFSKTAGFKSAELEALLFNESLLNPRNILLILASIFKMYPAANEDEKKILYCSHGSAVENIHTILRHLNELTAYANEYTKQDIYRINLFVVCRCLCLPFNPDLVGNGTLFASVNVTNGFAQILTKQVFTRIIRYLRGAKMPTQEENVAFINNIREQNKDKILKAMNTKTAEERNLMMAMKKIGLSMGDQSNDTSNATYDDNEADDEGEPTGDTYNFNDQYADDNAGIDDDDEFRMHDQEDNDDTLDYNEFGFIYS